jgi:ribosomal-protein-alanine N-acetyltransferase
MIETDRLRLRPPRLADAGTLFAFLGDPVAMRFTHVQPSLRALRRHIAAYEHQRARIGCAPWTIFEKAGGGIVGWGGLYEDPFDRGWGIEIGYHFAPSAWGRGYATELALLCLRVARDELRIERLTAFVHPDNAASRRVLEKAGFLVVRFVPEMQRYLYHCRLAEGQWSEA